MSLVDVNLREWSTVDGGNCASLKGRHLPADSALLRLTEQLEGILDVVDHHHTGICISSTSYVGTIQLGEYRITIHPKIQGLSFNRLLRYAFGFRELRLFQETTHDISGVPFADLLLHQLAAESEELLARGPQAAYERRDECLDRPRGSVDFRRLVAQAGFVDGSLPCVHHPRTTDTVLNQVVRQGLEDCTQLGSNRTLRNRLLHLSQRFDGVSRIGLNVHTLERAQTRVNRLTRAYGPALKLIKMLLQGRSIAVDGEEQLRLPGFLFDMNRFFQAVLSRFLRENLQTCRVQDEYALTEVMRYTPGLNPCSRRSPRPRPDFALLQGGRVCALLDAKYRDLFGSPIPREMLYQLAIYAGSGTLRNSATILYPSLEDRPAQQVEIRSPVNGEVRASVILKCVNLARLSGLVEQRGTPVAIERQEYARELVSLP